MLDRMMKWLRVAAHDETLSRVNSDAEALMARLGDAAYYEARHRAQNGSEARKKCPPHSPQL